MKTDHHTPAAVSPEDSPLDDIMKKYDKESRVRIWQGLPGLVIRSGLALFSLYCLYMTLCSTALPEVRLSLFLGFITLAGFLTFPAHSRDIRPNHLPWYDILLTVIGPACFFFHAANAMPIISLMGRITPLHITIGIIGILCLAELCRRCVGIPILCVASALLIYAFYNKLVTYSTPAPLTLRTITNTLFYSTSGVLGTPVNVCYTYIVLFIIFGAFLERTGIADFFIALANRLAGWSSGGPAKVAVISSALCGMVSGSSVGNTVTTGSVTIPMMKKNGYRPDFAAAVEASASTGGQIMPPIMGAAAFLLAEYIGIPYAHVALKAIIPALLYFAGIFIAVHLEAKALRLKGISAAELPAWKLLLKKSYLLLPLILLIALVSSGARTMAASAAISIFGAFAIGFIHTVHLLAAKHELPFGRIIATATREILVKSFEALIAGAKGTITVAVACAMAGIIAGCITTTGLASIIINAVINLAGHSTFIGLALTMLCCIVLGMGVPTTANYCIMASTCAPILIQMGFPTVVAHFFVFYFGIVADITPPVALAAYAGAAIAHANPMKTGLTASKLAIAAFIVPYIFAYSPEMLLVGLDGPAWQITLQVALIVVTSLLGLFAVAAALNGTLYCRIPLLMRFILAIGGLLMIYPGTLTDVIGFLVVGSAFCLLKYKRRLFQTTSPSKYGQIKRRGSSVLYLLGDAEYELADQPSEPCLYIKKDGRIVCTLHNAFTVDTLPERFAKGEKLHGYHDAEYDEDAFCQILAAALQSGRGDMDFTFAATLVNKD